MLRIVNNIIKGIVITSIIFAVFFMFVVAQDTHHLDICDKDDCDICSIIQIAQIIINMIEGIALLSIFTFIINFVLSKIKKYYLVIENKSLVYLKVQLNE